MGSSLDLVFIISEAIALLLGLTFHEFSHAWVANRLGDPTPRWAGRVTLNPIAHLDPLGALMFILMILGLAPIAWGKPVPINPDYMRGGRRGAALATVAGPASNLALALAVALIWRLIHTLTGATLSYDSGAYLLVRNLIVINLVVACFNLIPVPPLDGFGILEGIAPPSWDRVLVPLRQYGVIILVILIMLSYVGTIDVLGATIGRLVNGLKSIYEVVAGLFLF